MTSLSQGWREQFDRMNRSHLRLIQNAGPYRSPYLTSEDARDALYSFFQNAYHLKDWIKNDPAVDSHGVEVFITSTLHLSVTADLANGAKHLRLTSSRTGDLTTAVTRQSVKHVRRSEGELRSYSYDAWTVESNERQFDAHELAHKVVAEWRLWLENRGLLP
ncbi:hypothetical protein ACWDG9_16655 [Streptomyces sp. NPDC001073]